MTIDKEMKEENDYYLDDWKEMMCTRMQRSLHHCETPDGILLMGDACKGYCRYSHPPLFDKRMKKK